MPRKEDLRARNGPANRDLGLDLDEIQRWGATAVISLITDEEIDHLHVTGLREAVEERQMEWWHLPIPDVNPPGFDFERGWRIAGEAIRDRLRMGFDVLVHCKGGLVAQARSDLACSLNWERIQTPRSARCGRQGRAPLRRPGRNATYSGANARCRQHPRQLKRPSGTGRWGP